MAHSARMDTKITIQQWGADSPAQNSYGDPSGSWSTYATSWAKKLDKGGREFFSGGTVDEATCVFVIRYCDGINTKMRISHSGEYYDIIHIGELGRQDTMEITARIQDGDHTV